MGKKSRQRAKNTTTVTLDPADLVDVGPREPCPCGSGKVIKLVTLLPMAMPGIVRDDETVWIGLQTHASSGDPSRDLGHAITAALKTEPGNPIQVGDLMKEGPRLQDLIDTGK